MYICSRCGYQGSLVLEVDSTEALEIVGQIKQAHKERMKEGPAKDEDGEPLFPAVSPKYAWMWKLILYAVLFYILITVLAFI